MCTDASLAGQVGKLSAALEMALQVIAEQPTALDPFHEIVVRRAEQALAEAGFPVAVTT